MGWPQCNTTLEDQRITETPIWHGYSFHRLGLLLSAVFGLVAIAVSFFLIFMHAIHYSRPNEQRHIIRILFMVPVYAAVSFLSYLYYRHSIYFEVLRDCYEAFAIASFFSLLCAYIAPDLHHQKEYFRTIVPKRWVWPMKWLQKCCGGEHGIWRTPRSGLTWFNVIWVSIFQYCFIRVFMTCVAVATQAYDRYCLESLNPAFAHVWVMVIEAVAVTIAMYCLIQFYVQVRGDIQQHKPLLKVAAIKLVIFLSFWQTIAISFLTSAGVVKASDKFQTPDIKIGIPAMLLCIEMALFAIFHLWAFSYRPYSLTSKASLANDGGETYKGGRLGLKAILDSFNPWDLIKAVGRAARWLYHGRRQRHQDVSYTLSRQNTGTDNSALHTTTAYVGAKRPGYAGGGQNEAEVLLADPQRMGVISTHGSRDPSPYRTDVVGYNGTAGDIGIASTTNHDRPYRAYEPNQTQQEGFVPYSHGRQNENVGRGREPVIYYPPPDSDRR